MSTSGERTCQLRGGRARVLVYVADTLLPTVQRHDPHIRASDGPRIVTIPVKAANEGPGFRFEWQGSCLPNGPIVVRVQLAGTTTRLRVTHEDRIVGPRCDVQGSRGTIAVSLLGPFLGDLAI
jgi:hypothetical protein